jgi:ribosome maturation factor RimP
MAADIAKIVATAISGLGYELVDFERGTHGTIRVFIDKPDGISVEDCAAVSNHLTRLFVVELIDYERLEVSSPGLDRPLKTLDDFRRFSGQPVKVRLNTMVDNRKRFDAVAEFIEGDRITFRLLDDAGVVASRAGKRIGAAIAKKKAAVEPSAVVKISVALADIERARLIPDV